MYILILHTKHIQLIESTFTHHRRSPGAPSGPFCVPPPAAAPPAHAAAASPYAPGGVTAAPSYAPDGGATSQPGQAPLRPPAFRPPPRPAMPRPESQSGRGRGALAAATSKSQAPGQAAAPSSMPHVQQSSTQLRQGSSSQSQGQPFWTSVRLLCHIRTALSRTRNTVVLLTITTI